MIDEFIHTLSPLSLSILLRIPFFTEIACQVGLRYCSPPMDAQARLSFPAGRVFFFSPRPLHLDNHPLSGALLSSAD